MRILPATRSSVAGAAHAMAGGGAGVRGLAMMPAEQEESLFVTWRVLHV